MGIFTDDDAAAPTGWVGHQMAVVVALAMTASVSVGVVVTEGIANLADPPPEPDPPAAEPPDVAAPDPPVVLPEQPPAPPWSPPEEDGLIGSDSPKEAEAEAEAEAGSSGGAEVPPVPPTTGTPESAGPEWLPDGDAPDRPPPGGGVELPDGFFDGMPGDWCDSMPVLCGDVAEGGPVTWPPNGWGLSAGHLKALTEAGLIRLVMPDGEVVTDVIGVDTSSGDPAEVGLDDGQADADVAGTAAVAADAPVDFDVAGQAAQGDDVGMSWQDEGGDAGDETADQQWPVSDQDSSELSDGEAMSGPEAGENTGADVESDPQAAESEPDQTEEAAPEDSSDGATDGVDDEVVDSPSSGEGAGEQPESPAESDS